MPSSRPAERAPGDWFCTFAERHEFLHIVLDRHRVDRWSALMGTWQTSRSKTGAPRSSRVRI
ncbi:hypothetical protein, partial [Burkholderia sp. SIMBA_024]|uniref:hypothetical protein n=1 Tax=Burkholderia sp. SIMBA_024 TaxID=3085768 RepID=UPI00397A3ACA